MWTSCDLNIVSKIKNMWICWEHTHTHPLEPVIGSKTYGKCSKRQIPPWQGLKWPSLESDSEELDWLIVSVNWSQKWPKIVPQNDRVTAVWRIPQIRYDATCLRWVTLLYWPSPPKSRNLAIFVVRELGDAWEAVKRDLWIVSTMFSIRYLAEPTCSMLMECCEKLSGVVVHLNPTGLPQCAHWSKQWWAHNAARSFLGCQPDCLKMARSGDVLTHTLCPCNCARWTKAIGMLRSSVSTMTPSAAMGRTSPISEGIRTKRAWSENVEVVKKVGERAAKAERVGVEDEGEEGPMPYDTENSAKLD